MMVLKCKGTIILEITSATELLHTKIYTIRGCSKMLQPLIILFNIYDSKYHEVGNSVYTHS